MERVPNILPGEILQKDFLNELGITPSRLAKDIGVPVTRVWGILKGTRAITPDTALRLARYFQTTPELWLNLQTHHDLVETRLANTERYEAIQPHDQQRAAAA